MDNIELDFRMIFAVLRRHFLLIIIATLICGIGAYAYAAYYVTPMYTATIKMYVTSNTDRTEGDSSITSSELSASQSLVNTYIVILESDTVLDQVIEKLNLNFPPAYIRSMMSAAAINDTEVFFVSVTSPSPQLSMDVANAIAEVAPEAIVNVIKAGDVSVVDFAKLPTYPSSPDVRKITLIGAVLGFLISYGSMLLAVILDTKVHDEEDLLKTFTIPLIGIVPSIEIPDSTGKKEEAANVHK